MVAFKSKEYGSYDYDEEEQEWSDDFDSAQHLRDLVYWSGLSLAIGVCIGMAIMAFAARPF